MEQTMTTLADYGKKLLRSALALVRTTAEASVSVMGKAAGQAAGFVKEQTGALVRTAGSKAKETARDHRETLLIIGAVISGLALLASLAGLLLGRKNDR